MIVVAINYRLHCLGFMSSKELIEDVQEYARTIPEDQKQWYDLSVGNWGLLDQVLGLQWIQDHIQAFSGNSKRVTVMGQSAGACSISYLQLIPECRGLFRRSILVSGTATTMVAQYPEQGQRIFDHLCSVFHVPAGLPALEKVSRLRDVPAEAVSEVISKATDVLFRPYVDGVLLKKDCRLIIGNPSLYDPALNWVLVGTCGDEGTIQASFCITAHSFDCGQCLQQQFTNDRIIFNHA
jgi:carboxylesterase type B